MQILMDTVEGPYERNGRRKHGRDAVSSLRTPYNCHTIYAQSPSAMIALRPLRNVYFLPSAFYFRFALTIIRTC